MYHLDALCACVRTTDICHVFVQCDDALRRSCNSTAANASERADFYTQSAYGSWKRANRKLAPVPTAKVYDWREHMQVDKLIGPWSKQAKAQPWSRRHGRRLGAGAIAKVDAPGLLLQRQQLLQRCATSASVELVVRRGCYETVLRPLGTLLVHAAARGVCVRTVWVQEACFGHRGTPTEWASWDGRDGLLGVRRVAVELESAPERAHAQWLSRVMANGAASRPDGGGDGGDGGDDGAAIVRRVATGGAATGRAGRRGAGTGGLVGALRGLTHAAFGESAVAPSTGRPAPPSVATLTATQLRHCAAAAAASTAQRSGGPRSPLTAASNLPPGCVAMLGGQGVASGVAAPRRAPQPAALPSRARVLAASLALLHSHVESILRRTREEEGGKEGEAAAAAGAPVPPLDQSSPPPQSSPPLRSPADASIGAPPTASAPAARLWSPPLGCLEPDFVLHNRELELRGPSPSAAMRRGLAGSCGAGTDASRVREMILASQGSRERCASPGGTPALRVRLLSAGWLSTLQAIVKPLAHAVRSGRVLLTPLILPYTASPPCAARDLSCFFEPLHTLCGSNASPSMSASALVPSSPPPDAAVAASTIAAAPAADPASAAAASAAASSTATAAASSTASAAASSTASSSAAIEAQAETIDPRNKNFVRSQSPRLHGERVVPSRFRGRGWFFWSSHLLRHVMRPSARLAADVSAAAERTGLEAVQREGGAVIGMHVRHGDACRFEELHRSARRCSPFDEYLRHALRLARAHGTRVRAIFLATDSTTVARQARQQSHLPVLMLQSGVTRYPSGEGTSPPDLWDLRVSWRARKNRTEWTHRQAWAASLDVALLARCDLLVGKFTSNLFRSAFSLRAAQCDCVPPFVSLDAPWCSDYGLLEGANWAFPTRSEDGLASNPFANRLQC